MPKTNEERLEKRYEKAKAVLAKLGTTGALDERRMARKALKRAQRKRSGLKSDKAHREKRHHRAQTAETKPAGA